MSRGQGAGEGGKGTKGEARWGIHRACTSNSLNRKADIGFLAALFASSGSTPERRTGGCRSLGSSGFPQSKVVSVHKCQGGGRMCSGSYRLGHTLTLPPTKVHPLYKPPMLSMVASNVPQILQRPSHQCGLQCRQP